MNLALAIGGCTVDELEHRMSEREFTLWRQYAGRYGLPTRRLELHGAQIALLIAKTMGNARSGVGMKDFMFDPPEAEPQVDANLGAAVIRSMTSSRVRLLGQGRKKASH
jgi:hypothetical protein